MSVGSANTIFRDRFGTMINSFAYVTISDIAFLTGTTETRLLVFAVSVGRTRLGGTSRFKTLVNIYTSLSISLVTIFTQTRNARIGWGTDSIFVTSSILLGYVQAMIYAVHLNTIGVAHETISNIALITSTSDARKRRTASGVNGTLSIRGHINTMIS